MKLYLVDADNIYFPQIKEYFREIISSYDNGNYRSAMVMLYSTIVCDMLLKLKELTDVYSDEKAERILDETNQQRKKANNSSWEWELIEKVWKQTELLSDEAYAILQHIYSLRNFSAHPAMTDEYELIAPTAEITVAYIKKALDLFFTKPSVFAQNIVDRMSDDISAKKELYRRDYMDEFNSEDFVELIEAINDNPQIYNYGWQDERNTLIVAAAKKVLPPDFDFDKYEHFEYAKKEPLQEQDDSITADETDKDPPL